MLSPTDIAARALRAYPALLQGWLRGEPFAPLVFPAGAPPAEYRALRATTAALTESAKGPRSRGYRVEVETRQLRTLGAQSLPVRIAIDTVDDLLHLANKADEFAAFQSDVALVRATLPQLDPWLLDHALRVVEQHGAWPELLRVCTFFLARPRPGLYMRELPIDVHTKFVETHMGILRPLLDALLPPEAITPDASAFERRYGLRTKEPLVRLRFLDPQLQAHCGLPFSELAAPATQLAALDLRGRRCVIVENELTFLTLPPLPGALALWGGGFAVDALAGIAWLHTCQIWYWGDLDAQGFQILSRLRAHFPLAASLLMDAPTLAAFHVFTVVGTPSTATALPHLSPDEHVLFERLARERLRLEQEHVGYLYAREQLQSLFA